MQSLVYDFGQLDYKTEKDYAVKIVEKYVCCVTISFILFSFKFVCMQVDDIPNLNIYKVSVTDTLMACQNYMRKKKVRI